VTIGRPLPTYGYCHSRRPPLSASPSPLLANSVKSGIAGVGSPPGYLKPGRTDATEVVIPGLLGYRRTTPFRRRHLPGTGDLGSQSMMTVRSNTWGASTPRSKFSATASSLSKSNRCVEFPQIAQAAVAAYEAQPGLVELAALLFSQARRLRPGAQRDRPGIALPAAGLHGSRLSGAASFHPDCDQQQGRPQEAARHRRDRD